MTIYVCLDFHVNFFLIGKESLSTEDGYQRIKSNQRKDKRDRLIFKDVSIVIECSHFVLISSKLSA